MTAYYNEFDPKAAAWLRELIKQGHIADGVVDERSITDVRPEDLTGFTQCHFFAGIGGWSYALRLAGVPDDYPCWTGSPPCQPFSVAGRQLGQLDERHLAPTFMLLVEQCKPSILFGEQVAAAIGKGWLDDLFTEMERQGYACGSAVLPACSVGAPHKRDRLFFGAAMGNTSGERYNRQHSLLRENSFRRESGDIFETTGSGKACGMAHADSEQRNGGRDFRSGGWNEPSNCSVFSSVADTHDTGPQGREGMSECTIKQSAGPGSVADNMADPQSSRRGEKQPNNGRCNEGTSSREAIVCSGSDATCNAYPDHNFWSNPDWLGCRDGKFRPVESGTFPLANGIPARVGRLRGYGNAIVPQVAAEFIGAFLDSLTETPCTACGFPATDGKLCDSCEELYSAKSPNFYDLGGDDETDEAD